RRELYAAQDEGTGQQLQFEVEQAQLTLEVEFRRDGDGKVKVEVGLPGAKVGGEAGGGSSSTRRQTLTLTLQVHDDALGGSRAKIRRPTADDPGAAVAQPPGPVLPEGTPAEPPSTGTVQKRPWEQ
ncbi:trypco2 family protein, partial [Streptomyces sp. IB201691-2A2]|uniref:trypco2 family protein n=1 Tax=Streptomyces sp. IB201691-2A2 TaxID=2561920 RepID=UPI00117FEAA8